MKYIKYKGKVYKVVDSSNYNQIISKLKTSINQAINELESLSHIKNEELIRTFKIGSSLKDKKIDDKLKKFESEIKKEIEKYTDCHLYLQGVLEKLK